MDNLRFLPAQACRFDFMVVSTLCHGHMVEPHGAFVDGGLQLEHFAEAGGKLGESALELLFPKLAENAF